MNECMSLYYVEILFVAENCFFFLDKKKKEITQLNMWNVITEP